jgi:hypothetical protein
MVSQLPGLLCSIGLSVGRDYVLRAYDGGEAYVYLAYLDDSGSDPKSPVALVGAVVLPDELFAHFETLLGMMVSDLVPEGKSFTEFHATELYWGNGAFMGIPEADRHEAIRRLLRLISTFKIPFVYSGVDRRLLASSPMGSAHPIDAAFRMCALGIHDWLKSPARKRTNVPDPLPQGHTTDPLCLFISDEIPDGRLKETIRTSFKSLRGKPQKGAQPTANRLPLVHDDMYFGSSADSIGIQLADVCSFFMMRHLRDNESDEFYDLFCHMAKCAKPSTEWNQYRDLFRAHRI